MKTKNTKKEMEKELDLFRKLAVQMVANKIFLEYKLVSSHMPVEPEGFVEECIKNNFIRIKPKIKDKIWNYFLNNLVLTQKIQGAVK